MVKHVVKRDGRVVIFDNRKIVDAILKAMNVTEEGEDIVLAAEIASAISKINIDNMSVEAIQDQVEYELMNSPRKEVAKKYIAYRKRKIFFANGNFNNFMELLLKHKDEKYMLTLAEPHNPEIPSTLERLKFDFHPVVLAKTVSNDLSGVKLDDYQLLALYSPMEIQTLTATFGTENLPMVVTFGENAARAAAEANLHLVCAAPTPEAPSMAKAVDNTIALIKAGKKIEPVVLSGTSKSEEFIKAQEAKPTKRTRAKRKPSEE